MKVELNFKSHVAMVIREKKDPKIYSESLLFHKIKKILQAKGYDCIKKPMSKDGHLVSDHVYYVRDRKWAWCLWDGNHQIKLAYADYNSGELTLRLENGKAWG